MTATVEELGEAIGGKAWSGPIEIPRTLAVAVLDQLKAAATVVVEFEKWTLTDEVMPHEEFLNALSSLSELLPAPDAPTPFGDQSDFVPIDELLKADEEAK